MKTSCCFVQKNRESGILHSPLIYKEKNDGASSFRCPILSTTLSFSLGLVVPGVRSPHALAVFAHALRAWLGSCEHPQQSTHTEPLSSPSERHSHNEDMRPVDRDPYNRCAFIIYMHSAILLLKLVAPLRKNDVESAALPQSHQS